MLRTPDQAFRIQDAMERAILSGDHQQMLLVPPGYAKTRPVLSSLAKLGAWPALVVAPPIVAESVWREEAAKWSDLQGVRVGYLGGPGRPLRKREGRRPAALDKMPEWMEEPSHIETISYDNLSYLAKVVDLEKRYRAIVFDEIDQLKAPGSVRFTTVRNHTMEIPVRVGMTGSVMPNRYLELWSQTFAVVGPKALGSSFAQYRDRYFETIDYMGRVYDWRHDFACDRKRKAGEAPCLCIRDAQAHIQGLIKPFAWALPVGQNEVRLPRVLPNLINVPLPARVEEMERELRKQLFTQLDSGDDLEALSQTSVAIKARQLMCGAVYKDLDHNWEVVHQGKMDRLEALVSELQGAGLLIFYEYQHELAMIKARMKRIGADFREGASPENRDLFNAGKIDGLLLHPKSTGAGVNLQGGHHVCWTSCPWSWRDWEQGNGRQARVGNLSDTVTAHVLLCGPLEQRVWNTLNAKGESQADFLRAIAA